MVEITKEISSKDIMEDISSFPIEAIDFNIEYSVIAIIICTKY